MLTPLDIENKRFGRSIKGYNVDEVDEFLDELTVQYEKLYKENADLREEMEENKKEIEHYKNIEQTLQDTLVMAQTTADDIKKVAQQKADQIVDDANTKAKQSVEELDRQEYELRSKYEEKKKEYDMFKSKMERLVLSFLEMLKDEDEQ